MLLTLCGPGSMGNSPSLPGTAGLFHLERLPPRLPPGKGSLDSEQYLEWGRHGIRFCGCPHYHYHSQQYHPIDHYHPTPMREDIEHSGTLEGRWRHNCNPARAARAGQAPGVGCQSDPTGQCTPHPKTTPRFSAPQRLGRANL